MNDLPEPEAAAQAHSRRLIEHIRGRMGQGSLSFSEYMHQALYAPGLGYYMAGARRFGERGDFFTAPDVSDLFAGCLARQCFEVLEGFDGGVLELGAGNGRLAAGILAAAHARQAPLMYRILEPSAALREQQRQTLTTRLGADALATVEWLDTLPATFNGVILANEVLDALPVERFVMAAGEARQIRVRATDTGALEAFDVPMEAAAQLAMTTLQATLPEPLPDGYRSELCLLLRPWINSLAAALERGVLLLIDYGYPRHEYYLPERTEGTFACYYRHRMHDNPYRYPGLQDLTAHVDFTSVAESAVDAGLELLGYTSQAALLLSLGILQDAERQSALAMSDRERLTTAKAVKTLTLPGEMGERFQAIAFGKGYDSALRGFGGQDLCHRL